MTSDLDIWRTANIIVESHGDDAVMYAAQRADEFLEKGDMDGQAMWKRVIAAIVELQRDQPKIGESLN